VRDRSGAVVAALASSTSTGRSTVEQLQQEVVPLLVETAERITADLGGSARAS
jgi:IclR family pca regulon transcriptional regulator